jgi:putative hydrolase of the HAD superfamily
VKVITKGDLLHKETKVARSGLDELFWRVEIVSEKDEATYQLVLQRHGIDPATFVMVGNSVRSDVLPVLALGGRAVHVPYSVTWMLEHAEPDPDLHDFPVLESIADLPACIDALAGET